MSHRQFDAYMLWLKMAHDYTRIQSVIKKLWNSLNFSRKRNKEQLFVNVQKLLVAFFVRSARILKLLISIYIYYINSNFVKFIQFSYVVFGWVGMKSPNIQNFIV